LAQPFRQTKTPNNVDELKLAEEFSEISKEYIPVHFYGFGWGENTLLAYLALPVTKIISSAEPGIVFRYLVFLFNILFGM